VSGAYHGIQIYNKLAHINHDYFASLLLLIISEHQLPHVVNASHTMPTTYVKGSYVIETDWLEILSIF